jgi:hypothetical protein
MKPFLIIFASVLTSLSVYGQSNEFSANFKADSLGTNGFRLNSFHYDSAKNAWLLYDKNLIGYSKDKIETMLGRPHNDCMFMNGTTCIYYYMRGKSFQMVLCFNGNLKVDEVAWDTTDFSDSRSCGEEDVEITSSVDIYGSIERAPPKRGIITLDQVLIKMIKGNDTINIPYSEDSTFFTNSKLRHYLLDHLIYPEVEKEAMITGTVYVTFSLQKDSTIKNIRLLRAIPGGPGIDKEVLRILSSGLKQGPFRRKGKPQTVICYLPIRFKIE